MAGEHSGHRKRLDEKSKLLGFDALEEHEQLEKLLFSVIPQGNTNPLAHHLLDHCGSLYGVLTAEPEELTKIPGVGHRTAQFLHDLLPLLGCVERCMLRGNGRQYPYLGTEEERGFFAKSLFYGKLTECCYMVSLNKKQQAYRFDKVSEGSVDETPIYVKEMVKLALRTNADSVMVVHNHPSGSLVPSRSDIAATQELSRSLDAVGIPLIDHIIVACGAYQSLKKMGVY